MEEELEHTLLYISSSNSTARAKMYADEFPLYEIHFLFSGTFKLGEFHFIEQIHIAKILILDKDNKEMNVRNERSYYFA